MSQAQPVSAADLEGDQGRVVNVVVWVLTGLATLLYALRLYTRLSVIKAASIDDLFLGIALILSIAVTICTSVEVSYGMGKHIDTLTPPHITRYFQALWASIAIYCLDISFIKLSILLQFLRICADHRTRQVCYAAIAFIVAYGIETAFASIFQCTPIAFFWNPTIEGGYCINKWALYFANASINIFSDLVIIILPFFILSELQLPSRQKAALVMLLALGGFACVASVVRLYTLYVLSKSDDPSWDNASAAMWSAIELNVAIVCTSISTLRPLIAQAFPRLLGSSASRARQQNQSGSASQHASRRRTHLFQNDGFRMVHNSGDDNIALRDDMGSPNFIKKEIHVSVNEAHSGTVSDNSR